MKISVLLISNSRLPLLKKCLESIEMAKNPFSLEVILGFNGDNNSYNDFKHDIPFYNIDIHLELLPKKANGEARNRLISKCNGEYICFLDDDITVPPTYFLNVNKIIESNPELDIFGGPDLTPEKQTYFQRAMGHVIQSSFAMGPTHFRHKRCSSDLKSSSETELILCNLIMKREVFFKDNLKFHPTITRNEENILLAEAKELRKKIGYTSSIFVFHQRKKNIFKFIKAVFSSGFNRTKSCIILPSSFNPVYFIPLLFLVYLVSLFFIKHTIYFLPLVLYLLIMALSTLIILLRSKNILIAFYSLVLFITTHITYGFGLLIGALSDKNWKN